MIRFSRIKRVHFVGIGGSGMSGIAEVLHNMGFIVTGSDISESAVVSRLRETGIVVYIGHKKENLGEAETLVYSSAVNHENVEVKEALLRHIPVIPRAEMLAELMRVKYSVSIAGTHGKTTTTSMIATIFSRAGMDPTYVVGGKLKMQESGAKLGKSDFLIAEADESDGSFLKLFPTVAVITNIENDHLDYYGSMEKLIEAFKDFGNKVPFYGSVVINANCKNLNKIIGKLNKRVVTFGLSAEADIRAEDVETSVRDASFKLFVKKKELGIVKLGVGGEHNVMNSLAAIAASLEAGINLEIIRKGLSEYSLPERRFQILFDKKDILVVDDYAHHPTEIRATLGVLSESRYKRVIAVFQPHRYTRLKILMKEFAGSFKSVDKLILSKIYSANQKEIKNVNSFKLSEMIKSHGIEDVLYIDEFREISRFLMQIVREGDAIVFLSAGNLTKTAHEFAGFLKKRPK